MLLFAFAHWQDSSQTIQKALEYSRLKGCDAPRDIHYIHYASLLPLPCLPLCSVNAVGENPK